MSRFDPDVSVDGARNTVLEVNIIVDDERGITPSMLLDINKAHRDPRTPPKTYRVDWIEYILHKDLEVDLWWQTKDAPRLLRHLEGRGKMELEARGGAHNTADHKTGCVLLSATGWTKGSNPIVGSLTIHATKH